MGLAVGPLRFKTPDELAKEFGAALQGAIEETTVKRGGVYRFCAKVENWNDAAREATGSADKYTHLKAFVGGGVRVDIGGPEVGVSTDASAQLSLSPGTPVAIERDGQEIWFTVRIPSNLMVPILVSVVYTNGGGDKGSLLIAKRLLPT